MKRKKYPRKMPMMLVLKMCDADFEAAVEMYVILY